MSKNWKERKNDAAREFLEALVGEMSTEKIISEANKQAEQQKEILIKTGFAHCAYCGRETEKNTCPYCGAWREASC